MGLTPSGSWWAPTGAGTSVKGGVAERHRVGRRRGGRASVSGARQAGAGGRGEAPVGDPVARGDGWWGLWAAASW